MLKNQIKNKTITLAILAVIVLGWLNICLFTFSAKAVSPVIIHPSHNSSDDVCVLSEPTIETNQNISHTPAALPSCCLQRANYYYAIIKTDNNKPTVSFLAPATAPSNNLPLSNSTANHNLSLTYPPPVLLALATTIIRE